MCSIYVYFLPFTGNLAVRPERIVQQSSEVVAVEEGKPIQGRYSAEHAVDGNAILSPGSGYCAMTKPESGQTWMWWFVDLGNISFIQQVTVYSVTAGHSCRYISTRLPNSPFHTCIYIDRIPISKNVCFMIRYMVSAYVYKWDLSKSSIYFIGKIPFNVI